MITTYGQDINSNGRLLLCTLVAFESPDFFATGGLCQIQGREGSVDRSRDPWREKRGSFWQITGSLS